MSFISYAQNYEDVILWRALKHIEHGFYIDVGANDPVVDSVTKYFYDNGWSGINIEPLKTHFEDLVAQRVRDININAAASDSDGFLKIWQSEVRGWATADADIVVKHEANGHKGEWLDVPSYKLKDICNKYDVKTVHFMKIDVEGFEKTVLSGMDFSIYRPWVLVIEATKPNSQEFNHIEWEDIILSSDYIFAYCDGLNRFYVAAEHSELLAALKYPPNVFDEFTTADKINLQQNINAAQEQAQEAQEQAREAQEQAQEAQEQAQEAQEQAREAQEQARESQEQAREAQEQARESQQQARSAQELAEEFHQRLLAVYASSSWRLTRPIRGIKRVLGGDKAFIKQTLSFLTLKIKYIFRSWIIKSIDFIYHKPKIAMFFKKTLSYFPGVNQKLLNLYLNKHAPNATLDTLVIATEVSYIHPSVLPTWPYLPETLLLPETACAALRWVRLTGHVEGHYSLAIVNRGLACALERINQQRLSFVPYHGQPYAEVPNLPAEQDSPLHAALRREVPDDAAGQAISVMHHYPFITDAQPAGQRGIVFFWEETSVPADTIAHLNAHFDVVWVAAESVKRALLNSGCRPPVFVIPIGVDHLIPAEAEPLGALRVA
ncbi:MAG: FkbM family methyltransferase, partial [Shewanella sp.]